MKKTAAIALMLALCLLAAAAQALSVTGFESDIVERNWEKNAFFSRMQELTGIAVSPAGIAEESEYSDLLNRMLKGDVQTDVLFKADLTREQEKKLLDGGAIIDLSALIDAHMPNLSALLAENPQWREIISLDDGRIVSLPLINPRERQVMLWINRAWLEQLGLDMPRTLDELTQALLAIRSGDPNGNYKQDEIAADLMGVFEMRWLLPYFGVVADDYNLARDAQGKIVFAPEMEQYRAFVELLRDWYDCGILTRDAFISSHSAAMLSEQDEDAPPTSGLLLSMTPYTHIPAEHIADYEALLLPGPDGRVRWRDFLGSVWTGCFAVTGACTQVEEALRWADALYGEEGALLAYGGVEGEDYAFDEAGRWSFMTDNWRDVNSFRAEVLIYTGTPAPGLYPAAFVESVDSEPDRHVFEANARALAVCERVTQPYCLSAEKQARADELALVLGEMVDRGIARFATGEVELSDETYAAWLDKLRAAGSGELAALFANAQ